MISPKEQFIRFTLKHSKRAKSPSGQILFTRFDGIGDFVIWLGTVRFFKEKYPQSRFILICSFPISEVAVLSGLFDAIVPIDMKAVDNSITERMRLYRSLKPYEGAILFQCVYSRTGRETLIDAMVKAYRRIAVDGKDTIDMQRIKERDLIVYDELVEIDCAKGESELIRNAKFASKVLDETIFPEVFRIPQIDNRVDTENAYLVIVLSTSEKEKNWPVEKYYEVFREIKGYFEKCVLLGATRERECADKFVELSKGDSQIVNKVGDTSMKEFVSIISGAKIVLSGDTSAVHIAAMTRTPCVCISGGWHEDRFVPYPEPIASECNQIVCKKKMDCYGCGTAYTKECREAIRLFGCKECIRIVPVEDVKNACIRAIAR